MTQRGKRLNSNQFLALLWDCVAMHCSLFDHTNLPWPLFFKEGYCYGIRN